jgi:SAM-dependent methyltransferase
VRRRLARNWIGAFIEPRKILAIPQLFRYLVDWRRYRKLGDASLRWSDSHPQLADRTRATPFDAHYFFQASWLARCLSASPPRRHFDIGSSVTATAVFSAFVPTIFVDIRPIRPALPRLSVVAADLTALPFETAGVDSLSALHVIEHVGLGRYGDRLDPAGSQRAAGELARVLSPGGRLFVSVPVGRQRVEFNAHRVFHPLSVLEMFQALHLTGFAWVDDLGRYHPSAEPADAADSEYACGMFEFTKPRM